jgi:aspartate/glutamate racemase
MSGNNPSGNRTNAGTPVRRVVFLHTVLGLDGQFEQMLKSSYAGQVEVSHIIDQTIIRSVVAARGLSLYARRRVSEGVLSAAAAGAEVVQFTCSTISSLAEPLTSVAGIPVLAVDARMAVEVASRHTKIALFATNPATMEPSEDQLRSAAARAGRDIELEASLEEAAYEALLSGGETTHDQLVAREVTRLCRTAEALVLAQASTAGAIKRSGLELPETVTVYTSPQYAIDGLIAWLESSE